MSTICLLDHKRVREGRSRRNATLAMLAGLADRVRDPQQAAEFVSTVSRLYAIIKSPAMSGAEKDAAFRRVINRKGSPQPGRAML